MTPQVFPPPPLTISFMVPPMASFVWSESVWLMIEPMRTPPSNATNTKATLAPVALAT